MEENFLPISFAPGYFVSDQGRVKKSSGKIMSMPVTTKGYILFRATLNGVRINRLMHRVVAEHFIGDIEGMEINHKDFDKSNNRVENLEIVTRAQNAAHYKGSESAKRAGKKISAKKIKYTPEEKRNKRREYSKSKTLGVGRGGLRTPAGGRPTKPDKRTTLSVCLTPENAQYLAAMGRGKNDFLNSLLDRERGEG